MYILQRSNSIAGATEDMEEAEEDIENALEALLDAEVEDGDGEEGSEDGAEESSGEDFDSEARDSAEDEDEDGTSDSDADRDRDSGDNQPKEGWKSDDAGTLVQHSVASVDSTLGKRRRRESSATGLHCHKMIHESAYILVLTSFSLIKETENQTHWEEPPNFSKVNTFLPANVLNKDFPLFLEAKKRCIEVILTHGMYHPHHYPHHHRKCGLYFNCGFVV
jgi:hypothetical protein